MWSIFFKTISFSPVFDGTPFSELVLALPFLGAFTHLRIETIVFLTNIMRVFKVNQKVFLKMATVFIDCAERVLHHWEAVSLKILKKGPDSQLKTFPIVASKKLSPVYFGPFFRVFYDLFFAIMSSCSVFNSLNHFYIENWETVKCWFGQQFRCESACIYRGSSLAKHRQAR